MDATRVSNYGEGDDLVETLLKLMAAASQRVWIKVPWWDASPKGRQLLEAAVAAKHRGVEVKVLARPETSNDPVLRELRNASIDVVGIRYLHEKELLTDDVVVSHSMNFTNKEIVRNQNSGFVFDDSAVVSASESGFITLIENRQAASLGEEEWTPTVNLIPAELGKYLDTFDKLNPLQSKAVPAVLSAAGHVMVVAPTSAGKTLIGEVAALRSIVLDGKPAVWLLPARALANEVGETVQRWNRHGIRSVELTGETNMSSALVSSSQLWVATTEKFESLYRRSSLRDFIASVGCIIIDEVHLVGDPARGATLESLIARLRAAETRTRIVALSATVSNAEELAGWFNAQLVRSAWRPTILTTQLIPYDAAPTTARAEEFQAAKEVVLEPLLEELRGSASDHAADPPESGASPASVLVFCGSKNAVRRTAAMVAHVPFRGVEDDALVDSTFEHGVGMHFAGAPRASRALDAFRARRIHTLVATSGLSTGVNLPARYVVIRDLELAMTPIEVSQVQQMFGRAGRAGQEPEGFAFMLVPREQETEWRKKLATGYTASSQVLGHLGDALLAEILLGSVTDRAGATAWFKETFAYAQTRQDSGVDDSLDFLVLRGFVTESDQDGLAVTEIGALTSRLMIDVESAGGLITALNEAPVPDSADEAEELVLQILSREVAGLRTRPINPRNYETFVDQTLAGWTPRVLARIGDSFGTSFCMAAAQLALREPGKLRGRSLGRDVSVTDLKRAIEDMPRYLAWIAALGQLMPATWAPAVAGELSRRLTWWHLSPHPERGSGRLLWFLERLLHPESRLTKLAGLWSRALKAGFNSPDLITARPNDVDISFEEFTQLIEGRANLEIQPPRGVEMPLRTGNKNGRATAMTNRGARRAIASSSPPPPKLDLPIPPSRASHELAADVFLYTRAGDFAYQNLTTDLPPESVPAPTDPIEDARKLIDRLPELTAVGPGSKGIRNVFKSDRKRLLETILPVLTPDPCLRPVAEVLTEQEAEPDLAAINLRDNLRRLLSSGSSPLPRPAATVLRSGVASDDELEVTFAALAGALQLETGMATANGNLCALVRLAGDWNLAMISDLRNLRIDPVIPEKLPAVVRALRPRPPEEPAPTRPLCSWLDEFRSI